MHGPVRFETCHICSTYWDQSFSQNNRDFHGFAIRTSFGTFLVLLKTKEETTVDLVFDNIWKTVIECVPLTLCKYLSILCIHTLDQFNGNSVYVSTSFSPVFPRWFLLIYICQFTVQITKMDVLFSLQQRLPKQHEDQNQYQWIHENALNA